VTQSLPTSHVTGSNADQQHLEGISEVVRWIGDLISAWCWSPL